MYCVNIMFVIQHNYYKLTQLFKQKIEIKIILTCYKRQDRINVEIIVFN